MFHADSERRHALALFRYGVIAELVRLEPGTAGLYDRILEKAGAGYDIPGTQRTRIAAKTIRPWLNRRLWAYVEGEHHHAPHRSLEGDTPLERWARTGEQVRFPDADLDELFLFETARRVQKDRTVSLHGVVYEVDAALVGEKITLRYDPAAPAGRPVEVWHEHRRIQDAKPLDAYANCFVKRHRPSRTLHTDTPPPQPQGRPLALRNLRRRDDDAENA